MSIYSRTDLALEARELWLESAGRTSSLEGVKAYTKRLGQLELTELEILNEKGSKALKKPMGKYLSIDINEAFHRGSESFTEACFQISEFILNLIPGGCSKFLIAALGNPDMTPDALGSIAASNILVTHHLKKFSPEEFQAFGDTMLIRPGVLGTSGIESAAQIKSICDTFKPHCLIVIDALAGAELKRLCRCIQICDSGICPGSGVGNNREELSRSVLGIPVISIGVPTVIDAAAFSCAEGIEKLFVTPKDIDSSVRSAARLIAYGINLALHRGLSIDDIDMLLS